jgi:cellulose synthase/poly-beta-1,6-N-acetylglucosamine synthase-like glycosyltransferase/peptidoglycan/xylan/chitin deacetylase (PgdA/CDA1 family)
MTRRPTRGSPRAHWVLLYLFAAISFALLCFNGYILHIGAEGSGAPPRTASGGSVPATLTSGGPIVHIAPNGAVTTRTMPPKTIALTFDDGPDPKFTPQILAILGRYHAHATFFEVGSRVDQYPSIARRVVASGNEIGSHTFTHVNPAATPGWQFDLELTWTANAIAGATGRTAVLMRPPYSSTPDAITGADLPAMRRAAAAGYLVVVADHDTDDWRRPGVNAIVNAALPKDGAGAVVMMHDSGGDRSQTVAALARLIPRLQGEGYKFVTVSEGLRLGAAPVAPTSQRIRGELLAWTQLIAAGLADTLTVLMAVALALSGLRLAVQLWCARRHSRAVRRAPQRLRYVGPVSVIVPAFNESANIGATVRSLRRSDYPEVEVIVVDDGSTDGTANIVRALRLPGVRVIEQRNAGKPAALNTGIRAARGRLIVLVDGDTVFAPDALGRLVQPFADPSIGAVSGNTKVANRRGLLGKWQHIEYVIGFNLDRRTYDVLGCMPTVPGAIGAFRRETLHDVGGVPAATLAEDTDLTMATLRAGWRVVYAPDAVAWTEVPANLNQLWRQRYRWCYGTMQAMWKHRRSITEHGPAGRLGRRGLPYLLIFQILLPLCAPAVDLFGLYGLLFLPLTQVAAVWCGLLAVQSLTAAYALRLDGERLGPLISLPLQQFVYRQLLYLVVIQSTIMALSGGRLRWHRMHRTGAATAHARDAATAPPSSRRNSAPVR